MFLCQNQKDRCFDVFHFMLYLKKISIHEKKLEMLKTQMVKSLNEVDNFAIKNNKSMAERTKE
jgi:hypothetical protein